MRKQSVTWSYSTTTCLPFQKEDFREPKLLLIQLLGSQIRAGKFLENGCCSCKPIVNLLTHQRTSGVYLGDRKVARGRGRRMKWIELREGYRRTFLASKVPSTITTIGEWIILHLPENWLSEILNVFIRSNCPIESGKEPVNWLLARSSFSSAPCPFEP